MIESEMFDLPAPVHILTAAQLASLREDLSDWFALPGVEDLTGEMFEAFFAAAAGGLRKPGRPNRPSADVVINGLNYSCKTVKIAGRAQHKLGRHHKFIEARRQLPDGLSLRSDPNLIGNALIEDYNRVCRANSWDMIAHLLRFNDNQEFIIWMEDWRPLIATNYRWENTGSARSGQLNLAARDATGLPRLSWTSAGGQFYISRLVPADAQIFTIEHNKMSAAEWRQLMSQRRIR